MSIATTAPNALKLLWQEKVFIGPNDLRAIEAELMKRGYNFTDKNLMMALKNAKFLTRRGERGNYMYIQKYPFIQESNNDGK
ncbi:MAG: hypothetical protein ABTQ25_17325 [Nitrosomonas ureae]